MSFLFQISIKPTQKLQTNYEKLVKILKPVKTHTYNYG